MINSLLLEAIEEADSTYRDIYNGVVTQTKDFSIPSGFLKFETIFEAQLAEKILKEKYYNVYIKPLDMNKDYDLYYTVVFNGGDNSLIEKIVKKGSKWQVQSEKGKNLGTYDTEEEAKKRLRQVEFFKHNK